MNRKDALGNEIVFGNKYGWSTDSNGITTSSYGVAVKQIEKGGISFKEVTSKRYVYFNESPYEENNGGRANVKPCKIFPIK